MPADYVRRGRSRPGRVTPGLLLDVACSLTDRDRKILRLLRRHRVLTASQLTAMFFTDPNTARHRLTRLHRLHLVDRFRLPAHVAADVHPDRPAISPAGYLPSTEYAYVLDTVGAEVLATDRAACPGQDVRVRWRTGQALAIAGNPRLAHTLGANQLFVDLMSAARRLPDAELVTWWGEAYCHRLFGGHLNPDGMGVWCQDGGRLPFALEYDRGTETLARVAAKQDDYQLLEDAVGWEFWLLVVLPGPRREQGARPRLGAKGLAVATTSRGNGFDPAAAVWAPVFANPDGRRVRLIDLAGWPRPEASRARIAAARARNRARRG